MMGRSHLLLGAAGYLAVEAAAPGLLSAHAPSTADLFAGTLAASGAALLPDLDHPQATLARTLGPVTEVLSRGVNTLAGGHRKGTHTLWAWLLVAIVAHLTLTSSHAPWVALIFYIFCAALMLRVLTECDGVICTLLAAVFGGAAVLATGDNYSWLAAAIDVGFGLHLLGDIITTEGIPLFYPLGRNFAFPIIGSTDHWRERGVGALCGLVAFYLLVVTVFLPGWHAQTSHATAATAVSAPALVAPAQASTAAPAGSEITRLRHEITVLKQGVTPHARALASKELASAVTALKHANADHATSSLLAALHTKITSLKQTLSLKLLP